MNEELMVLGEAVLKKKEEIARSVHEERMTGVFMTEREKKEFKAIEPTIINSRIELVALLGQGIRDGADQAGILNDVENWGKEKAAFFFNLGVPLDEALKDTSYYRRLIWNVIEEEATASKMTAASIFKLISIFDPLLDHAVYYFSLTYVQAHQKTLENAKTAFLELSVPVVPLLKGVGVLPLIGNIDTERSRLLMEKTLEQSVDLKLTHLIFDVSGVQIVDTMVADQLFKVMDALSLIGVEPIITGIRPEVAQTMITLGLNINGIKVRANLHQAFNELRVLKKQ
ncbi:STAS domain-containing protein [Domibacillus enclensis]|uniref:Anti-anti-sigma factor n=1 Tax=Domibacillus enclensis TaxID=1017273 RepID=A0A1N6N705_9BACI|nr:STAS domain-containing protein [Domibacillus enclensis]OXS79933.1 anti-anti-sigma factor [Domibacillus enclensis]SIP87874.1 rsbT co-antagonist protein RsbR [Domibacillus enclensis]